MQNFVATRWLTAAMTIILCCFGVGRMQGQACDCQVTHQRTVNICVNNNNYSVTVHFCETEYYYPNFKAGHCTPSLGQNRVSQIKKICFNGLTPPGTNLDIINALYCSIANTGCNQPNPWGFVVPMVQGGIYCWQVSVPRCTKRENNCIVACGDDCKWCYYEFRWERNAGVCKFAPLPGNQCADDGDCDAGCENGCPTVIDNCCY